MKQHILPILVAICMFSVFGCSLDDPPTCGNGTLDNDEECDGNDVRQFTCRDGYYPNYSASNVKTRCVSCKIDKEVACKQEPESCNNGQLDPNEECDGEKHLASVCPVGTVDNYNSVNPELRCKYCQIDKSLVCTKESVVNPCGNSVLDPDEECDGNQHIADLCDTNMQDVYNSADPSQRCINCKLNKDIACKPKSFCGDNILDANELCDGEAKQENPCTLYGASFVLTETYNKSMCQNCMVAAEYCHSTQAICGNGILEEGELCDGNEVVEKPCDDGYILQYEYTPDMCTQQCKISKLACIKDEAVCGNGKFEPGEICDGDGVMANPCESGFMLKSEYSKSMCTQDCNIAEGNCIEDPAVCGDGKIENTELCDKTTVEEEYYDEDFEEYMTRKVTVSIFPEGVQCKPPTISSEDWPWYELKDDYIQYNTCMTGTKSNCRAIKRYDNNGICSLKSNYTIMTSGIKSCQTSITEKDGILVSTIDMTGNSFTADKTIEAAIICRLGAINTNTVSYLVDIKANPDSIPFSNVSIDSQSTIKLDKSTLKEPGEYHCFTVLRTNNAGTRSELYACDHSTGEPKYAVQCVVDACLDITGDFVEYSFTLN